MYCSHKIQLEIDKAEKYLLNKKILMAALSFIKIFRELTNFMQHQFSQDKPWELIVRKSERFEASVPLDLFMRVYDGEVSEIPVSELMKDDNCIIKENGDTLVLSFANDGLFAKAVKTWRAKQ